MVGFVGNLGLAAVGVYLICEAPFAGASLIGAALVAYGLSANLIFAHELSHGAVVRNPFLKELIATICFAPVGMSALIWRLWHNRDHHGGSQIEGRDPDIPPTLRELRDNPLRAGFFRLPAVARSLIFFGAWPIYLTAHAFSLHVHYLKTELRGARFVLGFCEAFLTPLALAVGGWFLFDPHEFFLIYGAGFAGSNVVGMAYIATNHMLSPLNEINDPLRSTLTVRNWKLIERAHFNLGYHVEHHIFPTMSPAHGPLLRKLLLEHFPERYQELNHFRALYLLFKLPMLYATKTEQLDPPTSRRYGTAGFGLNELSSG